MTNRYSYSRLMSNDDSFNVNESSHEDNDDSSVTKLRRYGATKLQNSPKRERWPGSASHMSSFSPTDAPQKSYIEHLIKPKETLQGLALLYRCSVFELKVANNIQKETEFFARRSLKIPVPQHSSLTEKASENLPSSVLLPSVPAESPSSSSSTEYLKQKDEDLQRLKEKARVYDIDSSDRHLEDPSSLMRRANRSDCQGDDCGLSWTHILGLALLVLLACPLLYFLYLELNLHKTASSRNTTDFDFHTSNNDSSAS